MLLNQGKKAISTPEPRCDDHPWYALRVQARFENRVSMALRGKGYQELSPLYRIRRRWSDRVQELDLPLFPGYLFCRFDVRERLLPILTTPGVIAIVGAGKTPIAISEEEIGAIQALIRSGLPAVPWPCLAVGDTVFVERGPLAGTGGIILNVDKAFRLVVSIPLLQRAVAIEIERDWVRPIEKSISPSPMPLGRSRRVPKEVA